MSTRDACPFMITNLVSLKEDIFTSTEPDVNSTRLSWLVLEIIPLIFFINWGISFLAKIELVQLGYLAMNLSRLKLILSKYYL